MDMYPRISSFLEYIPDKILATNNIASVSSLLPKEKIWHQPLVSNIQPREDALETLTCDDKHVIFFILSRIKDNLPLNIFKFLKKQIITSHEGISFLIPFGRVLSELFHKEGIIEKVQEVSLSQLQCWTLSPLVSPSFCLLFLSSFLLLSFVFFYYQ